MKYILLNLKCINFQSKVLRRNDNQLVTVIVFLRWNITNTPDSLIVPPPYLKRKYIYLVHISIILIYAFINFSFSTNYHVCPLFFITNER
jgi:hypothetical protein